jgi:glucuronate isomerase
MSFITPDFLLSNDWSRRLYHDHAAEMPIIDYHCHLPPADLAGNRRFNNLFEAWLEGDHYKWRAMRANGVQERYCTGDAEPFEKFLAYARTVPKLLRNPLHHWTQLELKRYFDIDTPLNGDTARDIWETANQKLADLPVAAILDEFGVQMIGTTDAPADSLEHHRTLRKTNTLASTTVVPTFRPDKLHDLSDLEAWNQQVEALSEAAEVRIRTFADFTEAIAKRHAFFHDMGGRLSDHGLTHLPAHTCSEKNARDIFDRARGRDSDDSTDELNPHGQPRGGDDERFTAYMMQFFAKLDHAAGWTHQLHLGAMRNNNAWAMENLGPDTGFDSIGDYRQGPGLRRHLGTLAGEGTLPQVVLYNLNPKDNYLFATMVGNYTRSPGGGYPPEMSNSNHGVKSSGGGGMQYGSGWWFLDQLEGMTWQINSLSNLGLLSRFVGMLTDSRSFLSFPRHEYFRRLLCELLGSDVEKGLLPDDEELLGGMVRDICFNNARDFFGVELKS